MQTLDFTFQKLSQLKSLPEWSSASSSLLLFLLKEWSYHLPDHEAKVFHEQITNEWSQPSNESQWQNTLMKYTSNDLFSLDQSSKWQYFIELFNSDNKIKTLQKCQEVTNWVSSLVVNKSEISFPPQKTCNYDRKVISTIPYKTGLAVTVLFRFPAFFNSTPHKHPKYVAEQIVSGKLTELNLKEDSQGQYQITDVEEYSTGQEVLKDSKTGFPHIVSTQEEETLCVATFAGKNAMSPISMKSIKNCDSYSHHLDL